MIPPIRIDALRERNALDEKDEAELHAIETPEQRLRIALELTDLSRKIGRAAGAKWVVDPEYDLAEKSRRYAVALGRMRR